MAWYAYCIGEKQAFPELARHRKPVPLESTFGVGGNQVFLYPACDLALIVSEHRPADVLSQKSGVEHAKVIAECFKHSTVLPFRFGTIFGDDETLRKSIRSNQRQFMGHIEKLRGKTEMHLKIFVDDCCNRAIASQLGPNNSGRQYLSNLRETATRTRERQTQARTISVQMHRLFLPLDEEVSCRLTDNGKMLLDIAHLIDRKTVDRYRNKFSTTSATLSECRMQLSGPWPPYHFVHRLTRSVHTLAQSAAAAQSQLAAKSRVEAVASPMISIADPLTVEV
jgi:hypothetical protein